MNIAAEVYRALADRADEHSQDRLAEHLRWRADAIDHVERRADER